MHIPSLLFEPLNSFIRLQKPQLGMVVYIRGSMGLQYHVHGNYSCTWTECVVYSKSTWELQRFILNVLIEFRDHSASRSITIQYVQIMCSLPLKNSLCLSVCYNSQVKLDLFYLLVRHRLSFLCIVYCSKECRCDANWYYRPLKK